MGTCDIRGCDRVGTINLPPSADNQQLVICWACYSAILRYLRSAGVQQPEEEIDRFSNEELVGMASGDPFRALIGRMVGEDRWKRFVKRAKRTRAKDKHKQGGGSDERG